MHILLGVSGNSVKVQKHVGLYKEVIRGSGVQQIHVESYYRSDYSRFMKYSA